MPPPLVSLALQPPSFHSAHSRSRLAATRTRRGSSSSLAPYVPAVSSPLHCTSTTTPSTICTSTAAINNDTTEARTWTKDTREGVAKDTQSDRSFPTDPCTSGLKSDAIPSLLRPFLSTDRSFAARSRLSRTKHSATSSSSPCLRSTLSHSLSSHSDPASIPASAQSAYSRVKQTIVETHSTNPLDTMSGYWHSLSSPKLQDLQQDDHYQHEQPSGGVDKNRKPSSGSKSSMNLQVDTTRSRGRGRGSCSSGTNISVPSSASSLETSSSATLLIQGKVKHDNSHCNSCSCSSSSSNNSINSNNSANSQRPTVQTSRLPSPPLSSTPSYSSSSSSLCPRSPSLHPARYDSEAQTTPFRTEVACLGTDGSNSATRPVESKVMPPRAQVASRAKFFVAEDSESEDEEMEENDGVHECYGNDFAHVDCDPWTQYQSHLITTCRETEQEDHVHDGDDEDSNTVDMDGDYDHGYEHDKDMEEDGFGRMPRPLGTQPRLSPSPSSTCESSDTVTAAAATTTLTRPFPTMQRRHSLLSDLLMAEKRQQQQQLQLLKERQEHDQDYHHTDSGYSPTNSDGEMTAVANISGRVPQHQYQYDRRETCHNMHTTCKKTSPLTRTKKVFKNLSELANISMTTSSLNDSCSGPCGSDDGSTRDLLDEAVPFAFGSLSSSPSSPYILSAYTSTSTLTSTPISPLHSAKTTTTTATMATAGLAAPVPGWTRSHVQVQIQSLVAQSTLTAQRALLNATTTLTDVLFHASQ